MPGALQLPKICRAKLEDVPEIFSTLKEFAQFEGVSHCFSATEQSLSSTLTFDPSSSNPFPTTRFASAFLLFVDEEVSGMALYYYNYSSFRAAPGVFLEDLYLRPVHRGKGYATLLLARLAQEAIQVGSSQGAQLNWSCLSWNKTALRFYEKIGGEVVDGRVSIRAEGPRLQRMAALE